MNPAATEALADLWPVEANWSPAFKAVLEFARLNSGRLQLQAGNCWSHDGAKPALLVPDRMMRNLVAAGLAKYSSFRWRGKARFAVEVIIIGPDQSAKLKVISGLTR